MSIGRRVRRVRQASGLSQRQVAERAGVGASYMSRIENGRTAPSTRLLEKLARALDVDVLDFFVGEIHLAVAEQCPVSLSGGCILDHRIAAERDPGARAERYTREHLRALKTLNFVLHTGSPRARAAVYTMLADIVAGADERGADEQGDLECDSEDESPDS